MREVAIKTDVFEFIDILEYNGLKEVNKHGFLRITGHIRKELESQYLLLAQEEVWVKVTAVSSTEEEATLFYGLLTEMELGVENGVHTLSIEMRTGSILMDTKKHIRTFQRPEIIFPDMLARCMEPYADANYIMTKGKETYLDTLALQYEESDWEFLKRLASQVQTVLVADSTTKGIRFYFGMPERTVRNITVTNSYSVRRNTEEYKRKMDAGTKDITEADSVCYIAVTREIYDLGDALSLNRMELYVGKIETEMVGSELYHTYHLKTKNGFLVPREYNPRGRGISLRGTVVGVRNDEVQVRLSEDENAEFAGERWFDYATPYSSVDGSGWYCMPEIGDCIRLQVPSANEKEAYAASSCHLDAVNSSRTNPDYKSIKNKQGKEVLFTPNSLTLTNNKGMSIQLLDGTGIQIVSDQAITIKSSAEVDISSSKSDVRVVSPNAVVLKQGGTAVTMSDEFLFEGQDLKMI